MMEAGETRTVYSAGDYVIYAGNGICKIEDIRQENFSGIGERLYYIMNSVYENGARFFVPVSNECEERLRPVFSEEKIKTIIDQTEDIAPKWNESDEERSQSFEAILRSGNIAEILWLVKILNLHKREVREHNKKFHACDEKILTQAEKVITEEFAFVLGLSKREVIPYIVDYIMKEHLKK